MIRRYTSIRFVPIVAMIVCAMAAAGPVRADRPETSRLTEEQQRDAQLMLSVLNDAKIDPSRRRDAAAALLARNWPTAIDALAEALDTGDDGARRAIAAAVAERDDPPPTLVGPLLRLVGAEDAELRHSVAAALARYENAGVMERLIRLASNADEPMAVRTGAITALAEHRQAQVIEALLKLVGSEQPREIRNAAFASLARLTGNTQIGPNAAAWRNWWSAHRDLPRDRWLARVVRTLSEQNQRLTADQSQLTTRLTDLYNRLYVASTETDRPALLDAMLNDPLTDVRLLGVQLVERKVLNAQPVTPELQGKLRSMLADGSPEVRGAVVTLLRDLDDEPAVETVILMVTAEPDAGVQNACLSLMAAKVRATAVDPALVLVGREATRSAAAGVLIAAVDAGLLGPQQIHAARDLALNHVHDNDEPNPAMVRLLSKLVQADDEDLIRKLLDHPNEAVRKAAAEAYLTGVLDIEPLVRRMSDPALGPVAADAIGRHGKTLDEAMALLERDQINRDPQAPWRASLAAVAGRLNAQQLMQLDNAMTRRGSDAALRWSALKAAEALPVDPGAPGSVRQLLLIRRAELSLDVGDAAAAEGCLQAIGSGTMDAELRRRAEVVRLRTAVLSDQFDQAVTLANGMAASDRDAGPRAAALLMDAADRALATNQTEQAGTLVAAAARLGGESLQRQDRQRLAALREQLAAQSAAGGPPTPVPADPLTPAPGS